MASTFLVIVFATQICDVVTQPFHVGDNAEIKFNWTKLDYSWNSEQERNEGITNGSFVVSNNIIVGIKVFNERVFVTVPRFREGVPSTLNEIVMNNNSAAVLRPFPNWDMQEIRNCSALQCVISMEVDPNTGYMWVIDIGNPNVFSRSNSTTCPAKIVILSIPTGQVVRTYSFPTSLVAKGTNFLNDIVIDYVNGEATFAYITDSNGQLVVYDYVRDESYNFWNPSMFPVKGFSEIRIENITFNSTTPIDGIAMSPDFEFVYYCSMADKNLYRIPTSVLRNKGVFGSAYEFVGQKVSQSDGMVFSQESLYFGGLDKNMVYKMKYKDIKRSTFGNVTIPLQVALFQDSSRSLEWPDTFSVDANGNLWFVANRIMFFLLQKMNFTDMEESNKHIWKVQINESGYLWKAKYRTAVTSGCSKHVVLMSIYLHLITLLLGLKKVV